MAQFEGDGKRRAHFFWFILYQIAMIIIFRLCTTYEDQHAASDFSTHDQMDYITTYRDYIHYSHIILAIAGYLFIYGTSTKGGYTNIINGFFLAGAVLQWGLLIFEFWKRVSTDNWNSDLVLGINHMLFGSYATVTILITASILSGYVSTVQLFHLAGVEVILYGLNIYINYHQLNSPAWEHHLWVHLFGAFFALGALVGLKRTVKPEAALAGYEASYTSNFFGLIGLALVFVFFPSYNAALHHTHNQSNVVVNTYLALASSAVVTFFMSVVLENGKLDISRIRNSTLAAGVALSSSIANLEGPAASSGTGLVAAITVAFVYKFDAKIGDVSHAFSTHFSGALVGAVGTMISLAHNHYKASYFGTRFNDTYASAGDAASNHVASFFITIGISLLSGLIAGFWFSPKPWFPKADDNSNVDADYIADEYAVPAPAPKTREFVLPPPAPAPAPVYVEPTPAPVAVPVVTRTILAGYGPEQTATWLRSVGLFHSADQVLKDGITGQDVLDSPAENLNNYFGVDDGTKIWSEIGHMAP